MFYCIITVYIQVITYFALKIDKNPHRQSNNYNYNIHLTIANVMNYFTFLLACLMHVKQTFLGLKVFKVLKKVLIATWMKSSLTYRLLMSSK